MVKINPHDILYNPMWRVAPQLVAVFEPWLGIMPFDLTRGLPRSVELKPIGELVKSLGFYLSIIPHPISGMKCCRVSHFRDDLVFEANGKTPEEAMIRASALAVLAHRARLSA